jgi:GH25 family lysozyme M1 (1,4-beta-N-acetylmuramidase)
MRTVHTFLKAFSESGGFMSVIYIIMTVIVARLQSTIYFTSLIKSFYKYQPGITE